MRFQRNIKMLRGQLPAAAFITVCFLLLLFFIPGLLVHTPGVHLRLPTAIGLGGVEGPTIDVAVDPNGRYFFAGELVDAAALRAQLEVAIANSPEPLTLVVHADREVTYEHLLRVTLVGREAGIENALLATLPRNLGYQRKQVERP
jgi:biopolymer transport protein ExbD